MNHSPPKAERLTTVVQTSISLLLGTVFTLLVMCFMPGETRQDVNASEHPVPTQAESSALSTQDFLELAQLNQQQIPSVGNQKKPQRLPNYFTQIGLSKEQVEQVRQVQQKHQLEIDKFQTLLEQKKAQRDEELLDVLTLDQKRKLKLLQKKATFKRKKNSKQKN